MAKTWYHNITQQKFNIQDKGDFMDDYKENDVIMKSVDGCAILEPVGPSEIERIIQELKENEWDEEE